MKKLSIISAYRVLLISIFCILIDSPFVYIAGLILLIFNGYKESLLSILLILLIVITNSIKTDYLPFGIVEKRINNYYVVDKLLYKCRISDSFIDIGDIVYSSSSQYIEDNNYLKKNIKFNIVNYNVISNFSIRNRIYNYIQSRNTNVLDGLNKFIYNINNYDDPIYNLGYGLAIYYLIKLISRKSNKFALVGVFVYWLLFCFDIKFYLLLIDLILKKNDYKLHIKIIVISLINISLFNNLAILLPILIEFYRKLDLKISFKHYLSLIESYYFGYFNLMNIFIFKYIVYFQVFLMLFSFLVLIFPFFEDIYILILKIYSYINSINIEIRGSLSFFGIILYILAKSTIRIIDNSIFKYFLMILCILCPINRPFTKISFIDVGQGDSILIQNYLNNGTILIDTGSKYNYFKLRKYLYSQSIYNIDYLVITHNDSDHNGNLNSINTDFKVGNIIDKPSDIKYKGINLINLEIDNFDNDNDNSLVYWTKLNSVSFLFTGDISENAEKILVEKYPNLNINILKVSHHGSNTATSTEFLQSTLPEISIISTSGMYGHPSKEVIDNLNDFKVANYITRYCGNIEIYINSLFSLLKTQNGEFAIIKGDDIHNWRRRTDIYWRKNN